jgi:hypothetical protein
MTDDIDRTDELLEQLAEDERRAQAIRNGHHPDNPGPAGPPDDPPDDPHSLTARELLQQAGMISAADLDRKTFPPMRWHVPGLLPEGLGLLVAPPKAGKSWMVAAVGLACATGGMAFGCIDVDPRPVLYLALEDGQRRLQDRHRLLLGHDEKKPDDMHLICSATPLTAPAIVAAFLELYGDACPLVIVDTLVKIRPQRRAADDPYQFDYLFAAGLKALLEDYPGSGLWAVHHARKAVAEDFVDAASGTHGLAGAADYVMVLRHPRLTMHGSLLVTGRDVPEGEYAVITDQGHGWRLDGNTLAAAAANAETRQQQGRFGGPALEIVNYINEQGERAASPSEIQEATGIDGVRVYLKRLSEAGVIRKAKRGLYRSAVTSVTSVTSADESEPESNGSYESNTTPLWTEDDTND